MHFFLSTLTFALLLHQVSQLGLAILQVATPCLSTHLTDNQRKSRKLLRYLNCPSRARCPNKTRCLSKLDKPSLNLRSRRDHYLYYIGQPQLRQKWPKTSKKRRKTENLRKNRKRRQRMMRRTTWHSLTRLSKRIACVAPVAAKPRLSERTTASVENAVKLSVHCMSSWEVTTAKISTTRCLQRATTHLPLTTFLEKLLMQQGLRPNKPCLRSSLKGKLNQRRLNKPRRKRQCQERKVHPLSERKNDFWC